MSLLSTVARIISTCVYLCASAGAIAWWQLMPGGFAASHPRFWLNVVGPCVVFVVAVIGLVSIARGDSRRAAASAWSLGAGALAGTATSWLIFSDILPSVLLVGLAIGIACSAVPCLLAGSPRPSLITSLVLVLAVGLGCFVPLALRAEPASTKPLDIACPFESLAAAVPGLANAETTELSPRVSVVPSSGTVTIQLDKARLQIEPLLTFDSTSASGGWTIFSRRGPERSRAFGRLTTMLSHDDAAGGPTLLLAGAQDRLSVAERRESIEIVSYARLEQPIYSHLNTFCRLTIHGHRALQLEFSPCGKSRFEPTPSDYPVGRPARFAYCDAESDFHVVEATSGEKGPFVELGRGHANADPRLTIGIFDEDRPVAQIHLDDWLTQLSTATSPTAGWGVAVNAIEFQRAGESPAAAVNLWISLAATSVGRGFDTVGHNAGTYRNRIVVEAGK